MYRLETLKYIRDNAKDLIKLIDSFESVEHVSRENKVSSEFNDTFITCIEEELGSVSNSIEAYYKDSIDSEIESGGLRADIEGLKLALGYMQLDLDSQESKFTERLDESESFMQRSIDYIENDVTRIANHCYNIEDEVDVTGILSTLPAWFKVFIIVALSGGFGFALTSLMGFIAGIGGF